MTRKSIRKIDQPAGKASGWLEVIPIPPRITPENPQGIISLPEYLQVDYSKSAAGRDYFKVLEGPERNTEASVKQTPAPYLVPPIAYQPTAKIQFSPAKKAIRLLHASPHLIARIKPLPISDLVLYPHRPNQPHHLELPDSPHRFGEPYLNQTSHALSWFRILKKDHGAFSKPVYLHCGAVTEGCITVAQIQKWSQIYSLLIDRRLPDDNCVGTFEVCRPSAQDWCEFFQGRYQLYTDDQFDGWYLNLNFHPPSDVCFNAASNIRPSAL
jgi:hypothetical protein